MDPRLDSSTQWSPFPEELCAQAAEVLRERFADEYDLENAHFVVEGFIYQAEIVGRYGLQIEGQLKQPNFEISMDYDIEKEKALELIHKSMDVVEHLWQELLEEDLEDRELDKLWTPLPFEKRTYYFKYSTINSNLEQQADRLLNEYEKKLVYENTKAKGINDLPIEDDDKILH